MKSIIRKDEAAVSPVIATILMVAITVVLAAVLYVMVSGLITGPGGTPQAMGVGVQPSSDGSNWIVLVLSTPTGKLYTRSEERRVGKEGRTRRDAGVLEYVRRARTRL